MGAAEQLVSLDCDLAWLPRPNECRLVLSATFPPAALITSAFALAFAGDRLLLTGLLRRGWDVPGGHLAAGECPEAAVRREVYEETGARLGRCGPLGYHWVRLGAPPPAGYPYPYPDSYLVFYWAHVAGLDAFAPTAEARARGIFAPAAARRVGWVRRHLALYEAALAAAMAEARSATPIRRLSVTALAGDSAIAFTRSPG